MKRDLQFIYLLLSMALSLSACVTVYPPPYSAEPIKARVVDADTKQPLEGVVVTADWELRGSVGALPLGGSSYAGELMVMEAVTGRNGMFHFPAWGPIRQDKGWLQNHDPRLILFKSGYRHVVLTNKFRPQAEAQLEPLRRSEWNHKTIALEPFKGTMEEYAEGIYSLGTAIDDILGLGRNGQNCDWQKVPRMLIALDDMSRDFEDRGVKLKAWRLGQRVLRIDDIPATDRCGSPAEFLQGYRR